VNSLPGVDGRLQYFVEYLVAWAARAGLGPRITSGRRTAAQQKKLYAAYVSGRSALPAAPPGKSKHEYGLAVDITANSRAALNLMGAAWRSWGLTWGGDIDPVHFEL
jgi:LAS superfamily LD-carboxypeptidase LdcB